MTDIHLTGAQGMSSKKPKVLDNLQQTTESMIFWLLD